MIFFLSAMTSQLTQAELKRIVHYEPETGLFTLLVARKRGQQIGDTVGSRTKRGYIRTNVNGKKHFMHRLAWLYMTGAFPNKQIDHRDGDYGNNRWANLREATSIQNGRNRKLGNNNSSGHVGVHFVKQIGKYRADIKLANKRIVIGNFVDYEDAVAARQAAEIQHFGEFRRAP